MHGTHAGEPLLGGGPLEQQQQHSSQEAGPQQSPLHARLGEVQRLGGAVHQRAQAGTNMQCVYHSTDAVSNRQW
jgi:hypothetical protein